MNPHCQSKTGWVMWCTSFISQMTLNECSILWQLLELMMLPVFLHKQLAGAGVLAIGIWTLISKTDYTELLCSGLYFFSVVVLIVAGGLIMILAATGCYGAVQEVKGCLLLVSQSSAVYMWSVSCKLGSKDHSLFYPEMRIKSYMKGIYLYKVMLPKSKSQTLVLAVANFLWVSMTRLALFC